MSPKIYDCMTFYNELDLLDIRFHELDPYVDFFVISEAEERFDKTKKPLFYLENRSRFEQFNKKVIYIGLDEVKGKNPEERYAWQYNQAMLGLEGCKEDDLILFSDGDEIPRGSVIEDFRFTGAVPYRPFHQPMFLFYVNWRWTGRWNGTVAMSYKFLRERLKTFHQARLDRRHGMPVRDAGWHFSQTGGWKDVWDRLQSDYRSVFRKSSAFGNPNILKENIPQGKYIGTEKKCVVVPLDDTFPKYLVDNQEKFRHLIGGPLK